MTDPTPAPHSPAPVVPAPQWADARREALSRLYLDEPVHIKNRAKAEAAADAVIAGLWRVGALVCDPPAPPERTSLDEFRSPNESAATNDESNGVDNKNDSP